MNSSIIQLMKRDTTLYLSLSLFWSKEKVKASDLPLSKRLSIDLSWFELVKDETYQDMSVECVPKNTKKNNNWVCNNVISPVNLL